MCVRPCWKVSWSLFAALLLAIAPRSWGQQTSPSSEAWVAMAKASRLSDATIAQLKRDSLAISGPSFRQSFQVYTINPLPAFATSDSFLTSFNVLLADSVRQIELRRAPRLREVLETAWLSLDRRLTEAKVGRDQVEPFARHLAFVIGPALRLLGSKVSLGDATVEAEVGSQVDKIQSASTVSLPGWLAPADDFFAAVDYRQCRPIGFYAGQPELSRYYQAVRWLQMVPLRSSRDVELGAQALLTDLQGDFSHDLMRHFIEDGIAFFGNSSGGDVATTLDTMARGLIFRTERHMTAADAVLYARQMLERVGTRRGPKPVTLHVLPTTLLADGQWLSAIDEFKGQQAPAGGIEVAAWLGSDLALASATSVRGSGFDPFVRAAAKKRQIEAADLRTAPNLYYDALAALFETPDPTAPPFLRGEAWKRKSLQAALAGWAQFRHAWELNAHLNEFTFGDFRRPAGFVEPNPEFFRRAGVAISFIVDRLVEQDAFAARSGDDEKQAARNRALWTRWRELERLAQEMESAARKQLHGEILDRSEGGWLSNYGEILARIMGYEGTSWENPLDDAPRWTTISHEKRSDQNLAVAVGRPRALYVLYPWNGEPILCRGAVMSYYEYWSKDRLTDTEWQSQLDQSPPAQPDWIRPLLPSDPIVGAPPGAAVTLGRP